MRRRKDEEEGEEVAENDGKSLLTTYNGIEQIKTKTEMKGLSPSVRLRVILKVGKP